MKIGDRVRNVKCDVCPKAVGKIGKIVKLNTRELDVASVSDTEISSVELKFGKGRPQLNRPSVFACEDLVLVEDVE